MPGKLLQFFLFLKKILYYWEKTWITYFWHTGWGKIRGIFSFFEKFLWGSKGFLWICWFFLWGTKVFQFSVNLFVILITYQLWVQKKIGLRPGLVWLADKENCLKNLLTFVELANEWLAMQFRNVWNRRVP
jgi:hypothetical protein